MSEVALQCARPKKEVASEQAQAVQGRAAAQLRTGGGPAWYAARLRADC